jgi:hypothetical protein
VDFGEIKIHGGESSVQVTFLDAAGVNPQIVKFVLGGSTTRLGELAIALLPLINSLLENFFEVEFFFRGTPSMR